MQHRRRPLILAVILAASLVTTGMAGGAAYAETTPLPTVNTIGATSGALNRVFGTVDPEWLAGGTYLPAPPDVDEPNTYQKLPSVPPNGVVLTPEMIGEHVNTVIGRVTSIDDVDVRGSEVVLSLIPEPGNGEDAHVLAKAITDAAGEFLLKVPTTQQVLDAAYEANGTVNMWIDVVLFHGDSAVQSTYYGGGAIYSSLMSFGDGTGLVMAPVNVGVLTIASTLDHRAGASLPGTPGDDPEDPATQPEPEAPDLPLGSGEAIAAAPTAPEPYVAAPSPGAILNAPPMPDLFETIDHSPPEEQPDTYQGADRCKYPKNQGRWILDDERLEYRWQPVGEVHGWLGTRVRYIYEERANTVLGAAIKPEGTGWKVSGGTSVTNSGGASNKTGWHDGQIAVPAEAEFIHVYRAESWCPESYNPDRHSQDLLTRERIYTTKWTGGIQLGSRGLGGDGWEEYKKAAAKGRAMTLTPGNEFTKSKGKSYKYTVDVSAFGVALNAESVHDVDHTMELHTTDRLKDWHAWGNKDVPASPNNKAVYISG